MSLSRLITALYAPLVRVSCSTTYFARMVHVNSADVKNPIDAALLAAKVVQIGAFRYHQMIANSV